MAKKATKKEEKKKSGSVIDFINWLTIDKKTWAELSYEDKKSFNPYILNKFLSMDLYLCQAINEIQKIFSNLEKEIIWKIYYEILPSQKIYINYIKTKNKEVDGTSIENLKKYFFINLNDAYAYHDLLIKTDSGKKELEIINLSFLNGRE